MLTQINLDTSEDSIVATRAIIAELCANYPGLKKALKLMFLKRHLYAHGDLIFLKAFLLSKLKEMISNYIYSDSFSECDAYV